ncbi:MAG TPA: aminotransferase class I/II-fold pyridoxal phosphate-dependent enzyme [Dongiaceae bacterium]|nr:aminotransferase class I/II-fold pyridoxal phosphate-dependent enzyme [Dongiaceae bacterium]
MHTQQLRSPVAVRFSSDPSPHRMSDMARGLIGSEVLKIAAEVRALQASGADVCNLTVGDFSPTEFRIPKMLEDGVVEALRRGETNYPPSSGMLPLRTAIQESFERWFGLAYPIESVLVAGGARPIIYAVYRAVCDPGDRVVYPVPSWNNNHYVHLCGATGVPVRCPSTDAFLPTAEALREPLRDARLLALCSPLNPSGTCFDAATLGAIGDLVLAENARPERAGRPLYVMYDQVYWMLTFGGRRHVDPVGLRPELAPYTIYVDGISKAFAATGVRVGWAIGPPDVVDRMSSHLGHVGAWAPRAEQVATTTWLRSPDAIEGYRREITSSLETRLAALHEGFASLARSGLPVEAIAPMGAIYLSVRFDLVGRALRGGGTLATNEDIRRVLLQRAGLAMVPFQAFGLEEDSGWFRLSVGAVSLEQIRALFPRLRTVLGEMLV